MRENQSKIAFLFGVDDHWGPQELYEEVRMNSSIFFSFTFSIAITTGVPHPLPPLSVPADNAANVGEADARAFKILGAMQPLENAKKFLGIFHVETDAIVADGNRELFGSFGIIDFNLGPFARAGVFDGIADEIGKYLPQHRWIAVDFGQMIVVESNVPVFQFLGHAGDHIFDEHFEI